jgi:hypothetical protein
MAQIIALILQDIVFDQMALLENVQGLFVV